RAVGHNVSPEWRSDPFAYRALRLAFDRILDKLAPPGEISSPRRSEGQGSLFPGTLPGSRNFFLLAEGEGEEVTPERVARMISDLVLMALAQASLNDEDRSLISRSREQEDFEYGMADARRALEIRREN